MPEWEVFWLLVGLWLLSFVLMIRRRARSFWAVLVCVLAVGLMLVSGLHHLGMYP